MHHLQSLNLHGCRNIVSLPGGALPLLQRLTALTNLVLRNCDGLQDGALCSSALASLQHLDLSGMPLHTCTLNSVDGKRLLSFVHNVQMLAVVRADIVVQ